MTRWRILLFATALTASGHAARADTLFAELGGKPGIERLVATTLQIWTNDPRVAATFEDSNLVRLRRMLTDYICSRSGGDCRYTGQSMADAHRGLHLRTAQFNAVAEGLQRAMGQLGLGMPVQNRLVALLAPTYRDVVTR